MDVIGAGDDLRARTDAARRGGKTVALVPTMGGLHAGHDALIRRSRDEGDLVVVSIFVNPLQFEDPADLAAYPRDEDADRSRCERLDVDLVWAPSLEQMYPGGEPAVRPDPGPVGDTFEGASRPGHFDGVLAAVFRLLEVTGPCAAYFGEKDAQQLFLVRRMVETQRLPVEVVGCPTVREADGLACSSRNARLSRQERAEAGCLFLGLSEAAALARAGERDAHRLIAAMAREVGAAALTRLDYAAVVDDATFEPLERLERSRPARALVAAAFPGARLIDNLQLRLPPGESVGDDGPPLHRETGD
jgi:pantoate--beta-alanine ligase